MCIFVAGDGPVLALLDDLGVFPADGLEGHVLFESDVQMAGRGRPLHISGCWAIDMPMLTLGEASFNCFPLDEGWWMTVIRS